MSLPTEIVGRCLQHVVGEHRRELRPHRTVGPRHGRIHVSGVQVGGVELVDDPRTALQLRAQHVGIVVDRLKEVALLCAPRDQGGGVPSEADPVGR